MTRRVLVLLRSLVLLPVGACATAGHDVAIEGRQVVLGMDAETVQSCAGIPTRTKQLDSRTEIFSYEIKNENIGGVQVNVPLIGGGFKIGSSGAYCHTIMRVVDRKVVEVNYTGDNDDIVGKEGVCAPIVRGCLRVHEKDPEVRTEVGRRAGGVMDHDPVGSKN
jgi:hypothetical protein